MAVELEIAADVPSYPALYPKNELAEPVVFARPALYPEALLLLPVVL